MLSVPHARELVRLMLHQLMFESRVVYQRTHHPHNAYPGPTTAAQDQKHLRALRQAQELLHTILAAGNGNLHGRFMRYQTVNVQWSADRQTVIERRSPYQQQLEWIMGMRPWVNSNPQANKLGCWPWHPHVHYQSDRYPQYDGPRWWPALRDCVRSQLASDWFTPLESVHYVDVVLSLVSIRNTDARHTAFLLGGVFAALRDA